MAPKLFLQPVPEPKSGKNRAHIDLETDEFDAELHRLLDLGATVACVNERDPIGCPRGPAVREPVRLGERHTEHDVSEALPRLWLVAPLALLVAGCSSGGGKHAAPTTTIATSSTAVTTTTVGFPGDVRRGYSVPPHLVATFGPCPKVYPNVPSAKLNPGIKGLDKKLVPISAIAVRVCQYVFFPHRNANGAPEGPVLSGSASLTPPVAAAFEAETNLLLAVAPDYSPTCPANVPAYFLTFASGSQRVVVMGEGCGIMTNGVRSAQADTKWLDELQRYTTSMAVPDVVGDTGGIASVLAHVGWVVSSTGAPCCVGVVVVGQNPRAGVLAPLGTTVTLTLAPSGNSAPGPTWPGGGTKPTG